MLDEKTKWIEEFMRAKGSVFAQSSWYEMSQDRINAFAEATEDWQFIHIDPERAQRETSFGGTIAHGFLTLSMLAAMGGDCVPQIPGTRLSVNYGFDRVRFLSPVGAGAFIRGVFLPEDLVQKSDEELTLYWDVNIEIRGQTKPALAARWVTKRYF